MASKIWEEQIKNGNFKDIIHKIKHSSKKLSTAAFINLLIVTKKYLPNTQNVSSEYSDMIDLCVLCCKNIKKLSRIEEEKYLTVLYHIFKFFIDNDHPNYILTISSFLVAPQSVISTSEIKNQKIYLSLYALTFNYAKNKIDEFIKQEQPHVLKNIYIRILQFFACAHPNSTELIQTGYTCIQILHNKKHNIEPQLLYDIYIDILDEILSSKYIVNKSTENVFVFLLNISTNIICVRLTQENVTEIFNKFTHFLDSNSIVQYNDCLNVFKNVIEQILRNKLDEDELQKICTNLNSLAVNNSLTVIQWICVNMYIIIHNEINIINNLIKDKGESYLERLTDLLLSMWFIINSTKLENCNCQSECSSDKSQKYCIDILNLTIKCIFDFLKTSSGSEKIVIICKKVFQNAVTILVKFKILNCLRYGNICEYLMNMFYQIIVKLKGHKLYNETKYLFVSCSEDIFELTRIDTKSEAVKHTFWIILIYISLLYSDIQMYKEALLLLAVTIFNNIDSEEAIKAWIKIKYKMISDNTCENVEKITIVSMLSDVEFKNHFLLKNVKVEEEQLERISMLELSTYHDKWPVKDCIHSAFSEVMKYSHNPIQKGTAFMLIWNTLPDYSMFENEMDTTINELKKTSIKNTFKTEILLANMFICKYQNYINKVRLKSLKNIDLYRLPINNFDDTSKDVNVINIQNEQEMLSNLDNALEHWMAALQYYISSEMKSTLINTKILQMIETIPAIYELHGHQLKKLKSLSVAYRYAKLLSTNHLMIIFLGKMLECLDYNSPEGKMIIEEANILIDSFQTSDDASNELIKEAAVLFLLSESTSCFLSQEYKSGYTIFEKAIEKQKELKKTEMCLISARIDYLNMKYGLLPCSYNIINHQNTNPLGAQPFYDIISSYKNMDVLSYFKPADILKICQMLDFALELANTYVSLYLPREARCHLRSLVTLTNALGLSLRTTQFLNVLSCTDIITLNFDDCRVKFKYINEMLCLPNKTVNDLLDVWKSEQQIKTDSFNSFLNLVPFLNFFKHDFNCDCYSCSNMLYQQLVIEYFHIIIKLNNNDFKHKPTVLVREILQKYDNILEKHRLFISQSELILPIHKNENLKTNYSIRTNLSVSYFRLLLDYIDILIEEGNHREALKKIEDVLSSVCGYEELLCYQVINAIELNCAMLQEDSDIYVDDICEQLHLNMKINDCSNSISCKMKSPTKQSQSTNVDLVDDTKSTKKNPNLNTPSSSNTLVVPQVDIIPPSPVKTPIKPNRIFKTKNESCVKVYTPVTEKRITRNKVKGNLFMSVQKMGSENKSTSNVTGNDCGIINNDDKKKKTVKQARTSVRKKLINGIGPSNDLVDDVVEIDDPKHKLNGCRNVEKTNDVTNDVLSLDVKSTKSKYSTRKRTIR